MMKTYNNGKLWEYSFYFFVKLTESCCTVQQIVHYSIWKDIYLSSQGRGHDRVREAAQGLQAQLVNTSVGLCFYQDQQLSGSYEQ